MLHTFLALLLSPVLNWGPVAGTKAQLGTIPGGKATARSLAQADPIQRSRTPIIPGSLEADALESHAQAMQARESARERWIEQMHRAAPGIDWRTKERRNQEAERLRRIRTHKAQAAWDAASTSQGARTLRSGISVGVAGKQLLGLAGEASGEARIPSIGVWEEVGSKNQAGQTRCATLGPDNGGTANLYVGSAQGGVWLSPNLGGDWQPLSDSVQGGADEVIALSPMPGQTSEVLVYKTGERIYRSEDGGLTWGVPTGFTNLLEFLSLQRLFDGQETVLALVRFSGVGGSETWLFRSQDKGQSFQPLWQAPLDGRGDFWTPKGGPNAGLEVHLALNGQLWRSSDGGTSFTAGPTPVPGSAQSHITGSEDGGLTLYAVFRSGSQWLLYRSDDAGATVLPLGGLSDYAGTPRSMVGFAGDALTIVYGGVNAYRSTDGGATFSPINNWSEYYTAPATKLHGDIRGLDVIRRDTMGGVEDHLFLNTDGGTYLSLDRGVTVANLSLEGLGVSQYYSTLTSSADPSHIAAGSQDQGYQLGVRAPHFTLGPSTDLEQKISGDYGHLVSGDGSHEYVYSVYPGVVSGADPGFVVIQEGETNPTISTVAFPPAGNSLYLPPIVADPLDVEAFYFLTDKLWRATESGNSWNFVLHSTQDFSVGAGSYLSAMAIAPSDPNRMVAATDGGSMWWSSDAGVTWTPATDPGPSSQYFYGSGLVIDPIDPLTAVVCGSGYGTTGVRITHDGGDHWLPLGQNQPETLYYDLAWSPENNGDLFFASEAGAYRYLAATDSFENIMGLEAPATVYWSVEAVPTTNRVRYGTFGRGIWDFVFVQPLREIGDTYCDPAVPNSTLVPGELALVGSPMAYSQFLDLSATQLPPNEFGYFLISDTRTNGTVPFWSDGYLCVDPSFHSFAFQSTGTTGTLQHRIDTTSLPLSSPAPIMAGQTWYFQAWHTDFVLMPTGNFTNAVGVYFH